EQLHRFLALLTALLAPGDAPLAAPQGRLGLAVAARVVNDGAVGQGGEGLQAQVYAGLLAGGLCGLRWYVCTADAGIPAIRFPAEADGLGCSLNRAGPAHR